MQEEARAKVNLTLAVLGRRADGYHVLDSLVAFAGVADRVTLEPGVALSLEVDGPTAAGAGAIADNLVVKAALALARRRPGLTLGHFRLTKNLPIAAGIGGGSSDAAAALRLLAKANSLPLGDSAVLEAARETGSDVPVCLEGKTRWMRGAGESLSAPVDLPAMAAMLVNPRVATPTADVFRALALEPGTVAAYDDTLAAAILARRDADPIDLIAEGRNDLEPPSITLRPIIGEALALMEAQPGCRLARMSGSGATVFGLFDSADAASMARSAIEAAQPSWWSVDTTLAGSASMG